MPNVINNEFYDQLAFDWYRRWDHPIALLRQENQSKVSWILEKLKDSQAEGLQSILDVGCGAGLVANQMAKAGYQVTGVDLSSESLQVACEFDETSAVKYLRADALDLPFGEQSFDVVLCLDFLEHIENPQAALSEIDRVLKPGGWFFYHTFQKNWLSYLFAVKALDWLFKDGPQNVHSYQLFIPHKKLKSWLEELGLTPVLSTGLRPRFNSSVFKLLRHGVVDPSFQFLLTSQELISYLGLAKKPEVR